MFAKVQENPKWCHCGNCWEHSPQERHCCTDAATRQCVLQCNSDLRDIVLKEAAIATAVNASRLRLHERQWNIWGDRGAESVRTS